MESAHTYIEKRKDQKINYDAILREMIEHWQKENKRPTILMHSCCAPCSTYTTEFLAEYADLTIFFSNSNIYPRSEYMRRLGEQKRFIKEFNEQTGQQVQFIEDEYRPNEFLKMVKEGNLENEPEGGLRCAACFNMRLDKVAELAKEKGYDYFGSALTISPKKNSQLINQIGMDIQKIYATNYLPSDLKKKNGYKRSIELCKEYDIYRQCYCGCVFSAKERGVDLKQVNRDARAYNKANGLS